MNTDLFSVFENHGVRFQYPADWTVEENRTETELFIHLDSLQTSFWTLSLFPSRPHPDDVLDVTIQAFRDEYGDVDVYPAQKEHGNSESVTRELEFFCLEMVNGVFLKAFRTSQFTALIMFQATDEELKVTRDVMEGISKSLTFDDPAQPEWESFRST